MNRHHPYSASFEHSPSHRGNSSPGMGRGHRYPAAGGGPYRERAGFNRGRGGYGSCYDSSMNNHSTAFDQGHNRSKLADYDDYATPTTTQHSYYENNYADYTPAHFPPSAAQQIGYNHGYSNFEDGPGNFDDGDNRGNRRPVRQKEGDDKVHDSIIEERIQRERPCHALFIHNIKYEANSNDVRHQFEEHGAIKTFFDLISTRGMVFVTYFDLRAAEHARDRLQGSEFSGRPIDVHYSLPLDDKKGKNREKNQQLQGTLQVTLRNSQSGQAIDDIDVQRKFQQFGDVKAVKPVGDRIDSRYVEFYDTRSCDEAFRLRHQGLQDGVMDVVFAWDANESRTGQTNREWEDRENMRGGGRGCGRGCGRGRGSDDDFNHRQDLDHRDRGGRYDDDGGGRGGRAGGYNDRYDSNSGGYGGPSGGGYRNGPVGTSGPSGYGIPPGIPPGGAAPPDDRLEQARKVQQLLTALKQPAAPAAPASPPVLPAAMPPTTAMQKPGPNPYYTMAPAAYPGTGSYMGNLPPPSTAPPGNPALGNLPPNILALLQSAQQQQRPALPPGQNFGAAVNTSTLAAMPVGLAQQSSGGANPQYQQLMAYLARLSQYIGR